jgi:hypothetical protein
MSRLGMWSAFGLFLVGIAYLLTLVVGMASSGLTTPILDPILAVMEVLTLLSAPLLVIMVAAVYSWAPAEYKVHGLVALAFTVVAAGLTSCVHFVGLTVLRQTGTAAIQWPSVSYALELLAWDIFLGLALIFAAPVFQGGGLRRAVRLTMACAGYLSLAGTAGPAIGDLRWQRVGILGYGTVLPVAALLLAILFRREAVATNRSAA